MPSTISSLPFNAGHHLALVLVPFLVPARLKEQVYDVSPEGRRCEHFYRSKRARRKLSVLVGPGCDFGPPRRGCCQPATLSSINGEYNI